MFKSILTAAAVVLTAGIASATQAPVSIDINTMTPNADTAFQFEQVNNYCEWVTLYDAWGNWVTVWQCY